ncbi:aryl-sulfate sulfotransferase [Spongiivirga sp. MCCC 1A20706]|uniref:aryl-sulfate sulfotransferase n=1 Tax=Spongiivirga sp. MCCC 1A20706 TaxID=3160963 RepID=UPI003977A06A
MNNKKLYILVSFLAIILAACNKDSMGNEAEAENPIEEPENPDSNPTDGEEGPTDNPNAGERVGNVEFFNNDLISQDHILVNDAGGNRVYFMDRQGKITYDWPLNNGDLGNDCKVLENGKLLAMLESDDPQILIGGFGGKIEIIDSKGNVEWSFTYSDDSKILHHDAEIMPNGNILLMTWERKSATDAIENGYKLQNDLFPDGIIEVDPRTNQIVWKWEAWHHLVQDHDPTKLNYGVVSENPHKIDINYNQREDGDITHGNAIAYDPQRDLIYLSINFYHEIWVIDHSTTIEEAKTNSGGTYNKGGDLVYRFGNPEAYQNGAGTRLFTNNHFPNLDSESGYTKLLVFGNGNDKEQSTVYELALPEVLQLGIDTDNEPTILWSFTHPDLYSPKVSGAVKLSNGNILITEGDDGIWEVTREHEVVWKFKGDGFYWRSYAYSKNATAIQNTKITF